MSGIVPDEFKVARVIPILRVEIKLVLVIIDQFLCCHFLIKFWRT